MSVSTTSNKVTYIGNGIAKEYAIPFPFLEQKHLKALQFLNNVQTERTDWTVSEGNMIFETAPEEKAQIIIIREVPLTQETDYRENEILSAETLERNFDMLTMQIQQLHEKSERAITVDIFDDTEAARLLPAIRQSVSDCAEYATNAAQNARTSIQRAQEAATSADNAAASETRTESLLSTKANTDGSNFILNNEAKSYFIQLGMPDFSAEVSYNFTESVTAPCNGFFEIACEAFNNTQGTASLNGNIFKITQSMNNYYSCFGMCFIPATKGTVIKGETTSNPNNAYIKFYPCAGEV